MAKNDLVRRIDLENFGALTASTPTGTGAAPHYFATYTVAASDSTAAEIAGADFVCDGIADEEQISLALASKIGGYSRVLLLSGTFTLAATILFMYPNCTLEGQGPGTVLLVATGFSDPQLVTAWKNYSKIANLTIDCSGDGVISPDGISVYSVIGCEVSSITSLGGSLGGGTKISSTVFIDDCYDCTVSNCRLYGFASGGITLAGNNCSAIGNTIHNCYSAIAASDGSNISYNLLVANNVIRHCYYGISVSSAPHTIVTSNQCVGTVASDIIGETGYVGDNGIQIIDCDYNIISGNYMAGFSAAGLYVNAATNNRITNNYLIGNSFAPDGAIVDHVSYAGRGMIFEDASSNYIVSNTILLGVGDYSPGAQWFAYELLGDSPGNIFHDNLDHGDPYPFVYEEPNPGYAEFVNTHGNLAIYKGAQETISQIKITDGYRIVPPLEMNVVQSQSVTVSGVTTVYDSINFIEKGWSGRDIYLRAYSSDSLTLVHSTSPDIVTANLLLGGADVTLTNEKLVHLKFDGDTQFWYLVT